MYAYIKNGTIDCISHEILEWIECERIDYPDSISHPIYRDGKIIEYIDEEAEKKSRVRTALISAQNLSIVDLEWVTFSDIEIGDIIKARVFGGNPHAESAFQAKVSAYIFSVMSGEPNDGLLISIKDKQEGINDIRLKFGLTII